MSNQICYFDILFEGKNVYFRKILNIYKESIFIIFFGFYQKKMSETLTVND